jgi:hypothetical protein
VLLKFAGVGCPIFRVKVCRVGEFFRIYEFMFRKQHGESVGGPGKLGEKTVK